MYLFVLTSGDRNGSRCETKIMNIHQLIDEFSNRDFFYGGPDIRPVRLNQWEKGTLKNLSLQDFERIFGEHISRMGNMLVYYPNHYQKYPFFKKQIYNKYGKPMHVVMNQGQGYTAVPL